MKFTLALISTLLLGAIGSPAWAGSVSSRAAASRPSYPDFPPPQPLHANEPAAPARYVTTPPDVPIVTVTVPASNTAAGLIFLATFMALEKPSYLLIVDDTGELVYYKPAPAGIYLMDFKRQPTGSLSYFQSLGFNSLRGEYQEMNLSYEVTRTWQVGAPYVADNHDLQLLPNGHALTLIYDTAPRDLSAYGGLTNTQFIDTLVQEVDDQRNVYFSWRVSDHIPVTDTYESVNGTQLDHAHGNAVEMDTDGNILLSSRHLSEITKINRQTGDIIWRLGGKQNQFTFTNDAGFSYQHDIRRLPNGHITIWDNGNQKVPPYSRAVEYEIDEVNKLVTRTWEFRNTPDTFNFFMGNVERLPNGNSFLGWGGPRNLGMEVGPDGTKRLEMQLAASEGFVYRWFRFPWQGFPTTPPTLVLSDVTGAPALYYSWNGSTEIASYRVESGYTAAGFTPAFTQTKTGFETSTPLDSLPADACFYRVMPVDKAGQDTRYSNVVVRGGGRCVPAIGITLAPTIQLALLGQVVSITTQISNTGITPLTQISVSSSFGSCVTTLEALPVISGMVSAFCEVGPLISDLTLNSLVSASVTPISTTPEISPAIAVVTSSAIALVKVITPALALTVTPTEQIVRRGMTATFTVTVENTGNALFDAVEIDSPIGTCSTALTRTLDVGDQVRYTCAGADIFAGFTGSLTATGSISTGQITNPRISVTDTAEVKVIVHQQFLPIMMLNGAPPPVSPAGVYQCDELEFGLIWNSEVVTLNPDGSSSYRSGNDMSPGSEVTGTWSYNPANQEVHFTNFRWLTATFVSPDRLIASEYLPGPGFDIGLQCRKS